MTLTFPNTVTPAAVLAMLADEAELRVWLDDDLDDRPAPEGWVHVTTVAQATALIDRGDVVELSLDNDLGDDEVYGIGLHVVDFICEQQVAHGRDLWPRDGLALHTANSYARDAMARAVSRYATQLHDVKTRPSGAQMRFSFENRSQ